MKKTILLFGLLAFLTFKNQAQTVNDIDGNVYNTITIGTQVWMQENLKVTRFNNGNNIPNVTSGLWTTLQAPALCYYNNDSPNNASVYGALYNFYTIEVNENVCPTGWHVPSDSEFIQLALFLGGDSIAGGKMKENGTTHWQTPNTGGTNSSGFTGLPGGYRLNNGGYYNIQKTAIYWSSTIQSGIYPLISTLFHNDDSIATSGQSGKKMGFSIRCVQGDITTGMTKNDFFDIKVYPNPANEILSIECADRHNVSMSIYTIAGLLVLHKELKENKNKIDISALSSGLYIIKVTSIDWTFQKKMVKE